MQPAIDWTPCFSAVIGTECACSRYSDVHPLRVLWIEKNRVQTHPACARLPFRPGVAAAQPGEFVPRLAAIVRTLNDLAEPAARLRRVDAARINRRTFDMINLPARKMRTAHLPSFARAIRC